MLRHAEPDLPKIKLVLRELKGPRKWEMAFIPAFVSVSKNSYCCIFYMKKCFVVPCLVIIPWLIGRGHCRWYGTPRWSSQPVNVVFEHLSCPSDTKSHPASNFTGNSSNHRTGIVTSWNLYALWTPNLLEHISLLQQQHTSRTQNTFTLSCQRKHK